LLYLSSSDVAEVCASLNPLTYVSDALRQHAAGTARVGVEGVVRWSPAQGEAARTLNMPGILSGVPDVVGTKIINANTGNPDRGLPRADGLTILFESWSARPRVIMQGAEISALRTAAVSTLAAERLARRGPVTLGVIGAGKIAETHARLMTRHLKVDRILVHDRVPDRAQDLVERLSAPEGGTARVARAELEHAVTEASVIVTATTATEAYIPGEWIGEGTLVVNVSLDDIDAEAYLRADLLYVDDWGLVTEDTQRLLGRLAREGRVAGPGEPPPEGGRSVTGTLGQLLEGSCQARESDSQIVVVNPFGMAIEDLALAQGIYAAAASRGLGTLLAP
jgi:ornithine cyclodeaminase